MRLPNSKARNAEKDMLARLPRFDSVGTDADLGNTAGETDQSSSTWLTVVESGASEAAETVKEKKADSQPNEDSDHDIRQCKKPTLDRSYLAFKALGGI